MLSEIGKELRKLRIEHGVRLKDMADSIGMTSAFLSAIETGKKALPLIYVDKISAYFSLDESMAKRIQSLSIKSTTEVRINLENSSEDSRDLAAAFARRFQSLEHDEIEKIKTLLNGGKQG